MWEKVKVEDLKANSAIDETYFAKLPDVRKANPEAAFVAVSRTIPRYIKHDLYDYHLTALAPSEQLLQDWKDEIITWSGYTSRFNQEIKESKAAKKALKFILKKAKERPVFLVCYEGPKAGRQCHRYLLLDILENEND